MDDTMKFIAFDLALLAAASTVGIYVATARLTLIGWLLQYKYGNGTNPSPLTKRPFVKSQVSKLTWFVFAAFAAGTLALVAIGARVLGWACAGWIELILVAIWALIISCFLAFHIWIECVHSGKCTAP